MRDSEEVIEMAVSKCEDDNPFYGDVLARTIEELDERYETSGVNK